MELSRAIRNRSYEDVLNIIFDDSYKKLNRRNKKGNAPVHELCQLNLNDRTCYNIFNLIVHHPKVDLNLRNFRGKTILHLANSPLMIRELLKYNVEVDARDNWGRTPLFIHLRNPDITELLLDKGADVNAKSKKGQAPVHKLHRYGVINKRAKRVFNLIAYHPNIDINAKDANQLTILFQTCSTQMFKKLVKLNVDVNVKNRRGCSPLMRHMNLKNVGICEMLIKKGADINAFNRNGHAVIHQIGSLRLKYEQHRNIMNAILNHPLCDLTLRNNKGKTIMHITRNYELIVELLERKVDVNILDAKGRPPLFYHIRNLRICQLLLENGASIKLLLPFKDKIIPKMQKYKKLFFYINTPELMRLFLELQIISVHDKDNIQRTPLMAHLGKADICRVVIEYGADVNIVTSTRFTPIMLASLMQYNETVELLIENGADLNYVYNEGDYDKRTAFESCIHISFDTPIQDLLIKHTKPVYLTSILKYNMDYKHLVEQNWDKIAENKENFDGFVKSLLEHLSDHNFHFNIHFQKNIFTFVYDFLLKHIGKVSEASLRGFFKAIRHSVLTFHYYYYERVENITISHVENTLERYLSNGCPIDFDDLGYIFDRFGQCKLFKRILLHSDLVENSSALRFDLDFYFIVTGKPQYNLNKLSIPEKEYSRMKMLGKRTIHCVHLISRYCTLTYQLFSLVVESLEFLNELSLIDWKLNKEEILNFLTEAGLLTKGPKSLLELCRNNIRLHIANKYKIERPKELYLIVNDLELPQRLKDVLMMIEPIYKQICIPTYHDN